MKKIILYALLVTLLVFRWHDGVSQDDDGITALPGVSQMIVFYTNIQRVVKGGRPVLHDAKLAEAALWQARYCAGVGKLTGDADVRGMETLRDRIQHFQGWCSTCRENLYRLPLNGQDVSGDDAARSLAYRLVYRLISSPESMAVIMKGGCNTIGTGVVKKGNGADASVYVSQVMNYRHGESGREQGGILKDDLRCDPGSMKIYKVRKEGKTYFHIEYRGPHEVRILQLKGDSPITRYRVDHENDVYVFERTRTQKPYLFVALYDRSSGMEYPVKSIW